MEISSFRVKELAKVIEPDYLLLIHELNKTNSQIPHLKKSLREEYFILKKKLSVLEENIKSIEDKVASALKAIESIYS
jgi:predicted nuclease with TOPRIM domain